MADRKEKMQDYTPSCLGRLIAKLNHIENEGYISGVRITDSTVIGLDKCVITPKGIDYICDDYALEKARDYINGRKDIPQFI